MKRGIGIGIVMVAVLAGPASGQTRTVRDTATAYGARLNATGVPANTNALRLNDRTNSRIENRLSLRIERYQPDATANPTAAYKTAQSDNVRAAPIIAPVPQDESQPQ
ncbi:hypothetical protein [Sphingomonas bacterium]|uniref:hypothetical protein n=1 Tax=Sphingomonas bacterium TaxID=1895847 RepID=UPI001575BE6D|nr:hypothetical protein [Sphingomonas bacterium]